jgi:tetratricopeptide (TPR) repeat protein
MKKRIRKKEKGKEPFLSRIHFPSSILLLTLIFLFSCVPAFGDIESATALFNKGNQSYDEGKFDKAIEEYEKIIDLKVKNYQVFYNLGNAYFRQNQLGKAILNYRRALALEPRDEDVKANLFFVKLFTLDKIEEQKINPFSNMLHWVLDLLSTNEFALLTSLFYILSIVMCILMLFRGARRYLLLGFIPLLILFLIFGSALWAKIHFASVDYGVVVIPQAEVRSGPGKDYVLQFTGHEGLEFRMDEEAEGWYRISLPNGIKGWITKMAVEII